MIEVKFKKLSPDAILPNYAHLGDAGLDAYSNEEITILPLSRALVHTGTVCELPICTELQVRSKSGLAVNSGLFVLNSPGTIDENYRGEICVILFNTTKEPITIKKGQKIAQYVVQKIERVKVIETDNISDETNRGKGGFGSTGLVNNKK